MDIGVSAACNPNTTYAVALEARDTITGNLITDTILGLDPNPQAIATDALSPEFSLSFDPVSATAHVFYRDCTGALKLESRSQLLRGGPRISVTPSSIDFGDVDVGGNANSSPVAVQNTGTANLNLGTIAVTGTGFSWNGGTCLNTGQVLAPSGTCTIIVNFAPVSAGAHSGNLSIPSDDVDENVSLSGNGLPVGGGGNVDLTITYISPFKGINNNDVFNLTVTVANQGTGPSGSFVVRGYFSVDKIPDNGGNPADALLFEWDVAGGLNGGESATSMFPSSFTGFPIHFTYYLLIHADADNEVLETDEGNNIFVRPVYVAR
ncbi:MAG: choice-of-anchor D domain-containing protein [Candidatus Mariimomonas ferrooxydans]